VSKLFLRYTGLVFKFLENMVLVWSSHSLDFVVTYFFGVCSVPPGLWCSLDVGLLWVSDPFSGVSFGIFLYNAFRESRGK
jgi:hypothetical protein